MSMTGALEAGDADKGDADKGDAEAGTGGADALFPWHPTMVSDAIT